MASPFPGMNPYLESPAFWSEFHNRLMVAFTKCLWKRIADDLSPQLRPRYRVAIERQQVLSSNTHFVEMNLLRKGEHFALGLDLVASQYYVLVARGIILTESIPKPDCPTRSKY